MLISSNIDAASLLLHEYLLSRGHSLDVSTIRSLLECCFTSSILRDEGRPVRCTLSYASSAKPDPDPPRMLRPQRWTAAHFGASVALSPRNLARYAQAVPLDVGHLAIGPMDDEQIRLWGFFDQAWLFREFRGRSQSSFFKPPGLFQIEITGPAEIGIYDGVVHIASIRTDSLVSEFLDVLKEGPVAQKLDCYLNSFVSSVKAAVDHWTSDRNVGLVIAAHSGQVLESKARDVPLEWIKALSRILLEIRSQNHGGSLLLLPGSSPVELNAGIRLQYNKVEQLLVQAVACEIVSKALMSWRISNKPSDLVPMNLMTALYDARNLATEAFAAMVGSARMVGSMAGFDGAIQLVGGLNCTGANLVIPGDNDPELVLEAKDAQGLQTQPLNVSDFGTRHRSVMRYCKTNPDAVGFVVSQDGAVRSITSVNGTVTFWRESKVEASLPPSVLEN
jgi:hypothetical protein